MFLKFVDLNYVTRAVNPRYIKFVTLVDAGSGSLQPTAEVHLTDGQFFTAMIPTVDKPTPQLVDKAVYDFFDKLTKTVTT